MTDKQLKMAVAQCAGWPVDLVIDKPRLTLDDVVAACEEADVMWGVNRSSSTMCLGIVVKKDMSGAATRTHPTDPAKALAFALCEACGVEVEDE